MTSCTLLIDFSTKAGLVIIPITVTPFSIRAIDGSNTTIDGFKRIGLNANEMAKKFANGGETAKQAFIEVVNRLGKMDDKVSQSIAGVCYAGRKARPLA